jgi:hypothetical protein
VARCDAVCARSSGLPSLGTQGPGAWNGGNGKKARGIGFGSTAQRTGRTAGAGIDRGRRSDRRGRRFVKPERSEQAKSRQLVLALQVFRDGGLILGIQGPALEPQANQTRDLQTRPERTTGPSQHLDLTRRTSAMTGSAGRRKARREPGKKEPAERQDEREPGSEAAPREAMGDMRGWVPSESFHREAQLRDQRLRGTAA